MAIIPTGPVIAHLAIAIKLDVLVIVSDARIYRLVKRAFGC